MDHRYLDIFLLDLNFFIFLQINMLGASLNSSLFLLEVNYIVPGGKSNLQLSPVRKMSVCQETSLAQSQPFTYSTSCWTCLASSCQATTTLKTHQINATAVWEITRQKVLGSIYLRVFCRFMSYTIEIQKVTDTPTAEPKSISIGSKGYELPGQ